jgi:PHD/YefM family antitoxin component YafN of YafNO toxin-antitoxin module
MLNVVTLRNRGIKAINEEIDKNGIATLTYRGKPKYVILDINEYEKLREMELLLAYYQAKEDLKNNNAEMVKNEEELKKHLNELQQAINV